MKIVLGGGISGLSVSYYLRRKYPNEIIQLYESANKVGGWIKSRKLPNGVIFEQGPRTLRPRGPAGYNTLQLIDELNLASKIVPITSSHPAAKNRMIYANGKLHTLPSSIGDIFKTKPPFNKSMISYILHDLRADRKFSTINDESIYDFVERRFGKDIAEYAISPLICGICAGDAKEISVKFLMKSLFENEQKYGGVIKGIVYELWKNKYSKKTDPVPSLAKLARDEKWSIYSFREGLQTLINELVNYLNKRYVHMLTNKTCDKLEFHENYVILSVNGFVQEYLPNHAISCLPAVKLAKLVEEQHPKLATYLRQIPSVNVAVVNLYYKKKLPLQEAFGFLVPPSENLPILGVIFDSCCFSNSEGTNLTVMMGGHWFQKLFGNSPKEEHLLNIATEQLNNILGIQVPPDLYKVNILRNCIPQYTVGHEDRVANIERYINNNKLPLSICGASYHGVGVNDVIYSSKLVVENMR